MQALSDIFVLDLSRVLAGPYCTMLLADFGAEVIKVEQPDVGDITRHWLPPALGDQSAYYLSINRNKKSITVNLKSEEGQALIRDLALKADVLVENFLPDTLKPMGLDYETLSALNPKLVYCSITGYGQTGEYRHRAGFDFMIQAEGGIMSITGEADGMPHKVGVAITDITAGLFASNAILTALHHRSKTGQGQWIDVALLDAQLGWLANVAQNYLASGEAPKRYGNAHPNIVPYQLFEAADAYLALAIGTDAQYKRFCIAANCPELWDEAAFQTNQGRVAHRETLIPRLQMVLKRQNVAFWLALCELHQIPASAVNDIPTILRDPHVQSRNMVQKVAHPTLGEIEVLGTVAKLSETPAQINAAPPLLGADTEAVLRDKLGYSAQKVAHLSSKGVV
jgi:formyl-CoA transferase